MLLLTSVNDRLQVVTSSTATINVHASWVDTSTGTITPGRTNTTINLATTTSIAGAPAASTQRNVKTLHVRNTHASLACDITVQHTDGTVVSQLYKVNLAAGDMLEYTDQGGFGGGRIPAPIVAPAPTTPKIVKFTASATYTPTANLTYAIVECLGGGGGGGGVVGGATGFVYWGSGGGSGGYSRGLLTATQIGAAQTITVGVGGTVGAAGGASPGGDGGDTSLGAFCIAKGGKGGGGYAGAALPTGGLGGISGTGDIAAAGNAGDSGGWNASTSHIPLGGASALGGANTLTGTISAGVAIAGVDGLNYGAGGSGAVAHYGGSGQPGGKGSAGICIITEYFT